VESPRLAVDLNEVIQIRQRAVAKVLEGGLQGPEPAGTPLLETLEGPVVGGRASGGV
jgi:hypothetical protein